MKKLKLLTWVLHRCGHSQKENKNNSAVGDNTIIIYGVLCIGLAVAMFLGGQYVAKNAMIFGSGSSVFSALMMIAAIVSIFLTIPQLINQLYLSTDLDVLISMPFTPMQIVCAKLINAASMPMLICSAIILPAGIGYGTAAEGLTALYWVALVLAALMLAMTVLSLSGILVIVIMRLFRRIRSRNLIAIISALLTFGVSCAYILLPKDNLSGEQLVNVFQGIQSSLGGVAKVIPMIGLTSNVMFDASAWSQLLLSFAATVALVVVLVLAARYLYFSAALGMQDANSARTVMNSGAMDKATRSSSVYKSLWKREIRTIKRTPSLLTPGLLQPYIMPLLVIVPLVLQMTKLTDSESSESLMQSIRELSSHFSVFTWLLLVELNTMLICSMGVGFSSLHRNLISREGKDYSTLKAMPITMEGLVRMKRNVILACLALPSVIYPLIISVLLTVFGLAPIWIIPVTLVFSIIWEHLFVTLGCIPGVKKPNLNWENEADACKAIGLGIFFFLGALALVIGFAYLIFGMQISTDYLPYIAAALLAALIIGCVVCEVTLKKEAAKLSSRF